MFSNNKKLNHLDFYEKRFKIEKLYQDYKSSGFNIEGNKIRKYDRFKRLLYCIALAHALSCFLGDLVCSVKNDFKKKFALHSNLFTAYLFSCWTGAPHIRHTALPDSIRGHTRFMLTALSSSAAELTIFPVLP